MARKVIQIPTLDPDDDSDAQLWRDYRAYQAGRREQNLIRYNAEGMDMIAEALGKPLKKHTDWHYSGMLAGHKLDYWPSRNKFAWKGRVMVSDLQGFIAFIKKRNGEGTRK